MKQLDNDLHALCVGNEIDAQQFMKETCQNLLQDSDILANSIIGESVSAHCVARECKLTFQELGEDNSNSNSLEYFGLANLLPKPQQVVP